MFPTQQFCSRQLNTFRCRLFSSLSENVWRLYDGCRNDVCQSTEIMFFKLNYCIVGIWSWASGMSVPLDGGNRHDHDSHCIETQSIRILVIKSLRSGFVWCRSFPSWMKFWVDGVVYPYVCVNPTYKRFMTALKQRTFWKHCKMKISFLFYQNVFNYTCISKLNFH